MDKSRKQLEKIFEQIISGNYTAAIKTIKKFKDSDFKKVEIENEMLLYLYSAFSQTKMNNFGIAKKEIYNFFDRINAVKPSFILECNKMLTAICLIIGESQSLLKAYSLLDDKKDSPEPDFAKINLESKLICKDFTNTSQSLLKLSKEAKKPCFYVLGSFLIKLQSIFQTYKQFSVKQFSDYYLIGFKLSEEDLKKFDFLLKCASQTVSKNAELNIQSVTDYIKYLNLLKTFYLKNYSDLLITLNAFESNYEFFCLIKKIAVNCNDEQFKTSLCEIYKRKFIDSLDISEQQNFEKNQPNFEEIKFIIDSKNNPSVFVFDEQFYKQVSAVLKQKLTIIQNNPSFGFFCKNFILALIFLSENEEELNIYAGLYVQKFSEQSNFSSEAINLFANEKKEFLKNDSGVLNKVLSFLKESPLKSSEFLLNQTKIDCFIRSANKMELSEIFKFLKFYLTEFNPKFIPAKGERRKEDDWLLFSLECLTKNYSASGNTQLLYLVNYLSMNGYLLSKYNFDILLYFVQSNAQLGIYTRNHELFFENDLKGNQNETMGYFFFSGLFEFNIFDTKSNEVITKFFKNCEEVSRKTAKNVMHSVKNANYNFLEEFFWNFDMNKRSYYKAIIFLHLENKFISLVLKNGPENIDNFFFASQQLDKLEEYCFLNLDFISDFGFNAMLNPNYIRLNHLFNGLLFEIHKNGVSTKTLELSNKIDEKANNMEIFEPNEFFTVIRKSQSPAKISTQLRNYKENYLKFFKTKQNELVITLIRKLGQILTSFTDSVVFKSLLTEVCHLLEIKKEFLNLNCQENMFLVGNVLYLLNKSICLIKFSNEKTNFPADLLENLNKVSSNILSSIHGDFSLQFLDLLSGEADISNFFLNKVSHSNYKNHLEDSFRSFKFFTGQFYKN